MENIFYIDLNRTKRNTAGAKAPDDIAELCRRAGYKRLEMPVYPANKNKIYQKLWLLTVCVNRWRKVLKVLPRDAVVIYQHPMYGVRVAERMIPRIKAQKNCKFIGVIHDLESLRGGIQGIIQDNKKTNSIADNLLLKHFDGLICHNERMKAYLIKQGFSADKLVTLEIFDYLSEAKSVHCPSKGKNDATVAIAGNLAMGKCGYIYKIVNVKQKQNMNLRINLYGNNYCEDQATDHMIYRGSFKPEELPGHLRGDFGLVWDGPSEQACMGNTGEYLKYNNPHKTSLYLASGMPVVVWSEAAIKDFVIQNGVGIAVSGLNELEETIQRISPEQYEVMCENAERLAEKLRSGHYFETALAKAMKVISN